MKKRILAMAMSAVMVLGTAAFAAGTEKTISVTPMAMTVNGQSVTPTKSNGAAAEVFSYDGATYVPLRYLSELLGIQVDWDKNDPNTAKLVGSSLKVTDDKTPAQFTPGTYTATVDSVAGPLSVSVTLTVDKIKTVEVTECNDTDGVYDVAVERIPKMIVDNQSLNVDSVSGATLTSVFLKNAVRQAVSQGCKDLSVLQTPVPFVAPPVSDMETDVLVIGGGIAGLTTALASVEQGLKVVLVEKNAYLGGSAIMSERTISNVPGLNPIDNAIEMLAGVGIDMVPGDVNPMYFVMDDPEEGRSMISSMMNRMAEQIKAKGGVILTDTAAVGLNTSRGAVSGATIQARGREETATVTARGTVLCTGGFQQNKELVEQYMPQFKGIRVSSAPGATGDAITWVEDLGGYMVMPEAGVRGYSVNPSTGYRTVYGFAPYLYVDKTGKTFTDKTDYSDVPQEAWAKFGNETYYAILTQSDIEAEGFDTELFEHMVKSGSTVKFTSIDDIVAQYDLFDLKATLESAGKANETAWYVGPSKAAIYSTLGGVAANGNGCVLDTWGELIHGLYAAGEVLGSQGYQTYGFYMGQLGSSLNMGTKVADYIARNKDKIGTGTALSFHHMMVGCKDLNKMVDFWVNFMGLQAIAGGSYPTPPEELVYAGLSAELCDEMFMHENQELNVVMCVEPEGRVSIELWNCEQMEINGGDPYWTTGVHELGLMVDDIDAWYKKVVDAGYKPTTSAPWSASGGTERTFLFFDPEGNLIQLTERDRGPQWNTLAPYLDHSWEKK